MVAIILGLNMARNWERTEYSFHGFIQTFGDYLWSPSYFAAKRSATLRARYPAPEGAGLRGQVGGSNGALKQKMR
jgi:hypothetical protein